jgi:uncharacterized protein YqjF (DUF2071 family)
VPIFSGWPPRARWYKVEAIVWRSFPRRILTQTEHRPWPMPDRPWVMTQSWHDLLFAHWPLPPSSLSPRIPEAFSLDTFEGSAWLGIVPFHMTNVAPRGFPILPWVSSFPELNVRTYVSVGGKPGVLFFSLDAARAHAVLAARAFFHLPYFTAAMEVRLHGDAVAYRSRRRGRGHPTAALAGTYEPLSHAFEAAPGSLEHFLTERYCLYHLDHRGRPYRLDIHHLPWALQPARADLEINTMAQAAGIPLPPSAPLLHFAKRQDMVAWMPERL